MKKNIAFYISDHNKEHILRNIPIITNILKIEEEVHLFIKSGESRISFMQSFFGYEERLHFYGMEMKDCQIDCWDEMAEKESLFLQKEQIGLVVSDICPWIFLATDDMRIKSLLLGHYTWADICEDEEEKEEYLSCYELASRFFIYDLHSPQMTECGVEYDLMSMMNKPYNLEKIETLGMQFGNPLVFVDVRSVDGPIDVSGLPYYFITVEGTDLCGDNVMILPKETKNTQDYVAVSSYVIADATWNRIGEVVLANRKSALIGRENLPWSKEMVAVLKERQQCIEIGEDELKDMKSLLDGLKEFRYSFDQEYYNSDYDLAKKILFAYPEKRRRNRS